MSLQIISRHVASLRRAVASPAQVFRSSSSTFLHGTHILSLDCLSTGKGVLNLPLKWIAAASYKQPVGTARPENTKPKQRPNSNNPWKGSNDGQGNVAVVPLKRRSGDRSNARNGPPFLLSKSTQALNPSFHSRLQSNWTASKLSRALHSAVGDDDESDVDLDDFLIDEDTPKSKERSSTSPIIPTKKRKASAIDACEDSEEEEEEESLFSSEMRRSAPLSKVKPQRAANARKVAESRVTSMKKRPVALEGLLDSESDGGRKKPDSSHEAESDQTGPLDQESRPSSDNTKQFNGSAALQYADSSPSYLTNTRPASDNTKQFDGSAALQDADSSPSYLTNTRFDKFPISPLSIKALHSVLKYERMTEVQEATFPVILNGQDVLAKARTGTGKTIAFLLPAIEAILKAPEGKSRNPIHVVIVCPTRELAQQAAAEAQTLLQFHRGLGAQVVYGGNSIRGEQMNLSRKPCQILVGTPGRLVDHIQRTPELERQLKSVKLFVLDEADHMLDMGFRDSLHKIMQALPSKRQTLLFSATIPKEVHSISKVALKNDHVFIDAVGTDSQDTHAQVKQQYIMVPLEKQLRVLYAALKQHTEVEPHYKVLVFCTTARGTGFLCKLFLNLGFNAREIHSRKDQNYRTRVSDEFRKSKGGIILFTSDVSARGVDYPNVTLVTQVGAPSDLEQYIHRLGRTGRAGKKGEGLLLLAPWEEYFLQKLSNLPITQMQAPKLTASAKQKILTSAATVDEATKEMAYTAWLGYYRSLKGLTLEKVMLVEYANQYSYSMGYDEPPALSRMVASKMALAGVPGLRIRR